MSACRAARLKDQFVFDISVGENGWIPNGRLTSVCSRRPDVNRLSEQLRRG